MEHSELIDAFSEFKELKNIDRASMMSILEDVNKEIYLTEAMDELNQRYGNYTVTFASSLGASREIKQKIPFGSTRYFELLIQQT